MVALMLKRCYAPGRVLRISAPLDRSPKWVGWRALELRFPKSYWSEAVRDLVRKELVDFAVCIDEASHMRFLYYDPAFEAFYDFSGFLESASYGT